MTAPDLAAIEAAHDAKIRAMLLNQYKWDVKDFVFFEEQVKQEFNFPEADLCRIHGLTTF